MATPQEILEEIRSVVEDLPTARDPGSSFARLDPQQSFGDATPEELELGGVESFRVRAGPFAYTQRWGRDGVYERDAVFVVELHHPIHEGAGTTDEEREAWAAQDVSRVAEALENRDWSTDGIQAVFFLAGGETNRSNAQDWETELRFRVVYTGSEGA